MNLSSDLISQFVKITNDKPKTTTKESTVYGTITKEDDKLYVKIDGSELITPINTTADIQPGERVTVMIKDHSATVMGNITTPSASSTEVKDVENRLDDKADIGDLDIEAARLDLIEIDIGDMQELLDGNITTENILSVNASKINGGLLNISLVDLANDDGSITLNDTTQQFKDGDGNIRMRMGKNPDGEFVFVVYKKGGAEQLINQNGITASAIADGLITDRMVSDNAKISGGKVFINDLNQTLEQILSSIQRDITDLKKDVDEDEDFIIDIGDTVEKINWLIKSGTSMNDMLLTDRVYELVNDNIDLHGYTTNNGVFMIDTDGTINSDYLVINQGISTDILNVGTINNNEYPKSLHRNITVHLDQSSNGSDVFHNGVVFNSIENLKSVAPRNLNGYTLTIVIDSNYNGDILLTGFHSGQINIEFNSYIVYGHIYCSGNSVVYNFIGGTSYGKIMPYTGYTVDGESYSMCFEGCDWVLTNMSIFPDITNNTTSNGIYSSRNKGIIKSAISKNSLKHFVKVNCASVYIDSSSGTCNNAAFYATSGGVIRLNNEKTQTGRDNSTGNAYMYDNGGEVIIDGVTFSNTSSSETNTNSNNVMTKTVTYLGTADTYMYDYGWRNDSTARQGRWEEGDCTGIWFFGSSFAEIVSKNITKIDILISRQTGGNSGGIQHSLYTHEYEDRPDSEPSLGTMIGTVTINPGDDAVLTITDTNLISAIKSAKGVGIKNTFDKSHYSICSSGIKVKFYYK